jgi:heptosyltransferase II
VIEYKKILVLQTAFLGDVVLTLPLVQVLKKNYPKAQVDMIVIPKVSGLLANHPDLNEVLVFDKREKDSGVIGMFRLAGILRKRNYDVAFVPHRSLRSALVVFLARIPQRIGFHKSAGKFLLNKIVQYNSSIHEIERNLFLLKGIGEEVKGKEFPQLYPSQIDKEVVDELLLSENITSGKIMIGISPGTVWNTKRWLEERFIELTKKLVDVGYRVAFVGGDEDAELCNRIKNSSSAGNVFSAAGKLTILQSAELIRRCSVLVCNDSAPMHLAVAMKTPVVAIFGATVPEFGFAPYGTQDVVIGIEGLRCRPCSIHGGDKCPIKTFDCMKNIPSDEVFSKVIELVNKTSR